MKADKITICHRSIFSHKKILIRDSFPDKYFFIAKQIYAADIRYTLTAQAVMPVHITALDMCAQKKRGTPNVIKLRIAYLN